MSECHVYIETSIRWPRQGSGIVGIIFTNVDDTDSKTLFGQVKDSTEYRAVLFGIKNALRYCRGYDVINLHLTCNYVGNAFRWIEVWEKTSFVTAKNRPVKNNDLWQEIAKEIKNKQLVIHLNEFNGYRKWLKVECDNRGRKHGFIL